MSKHIITFGDPVDLEVVTRAACGQYSRAIAKATGLSVAQVQYRLRKSGAGTDRQEFREGSSRFSKLIMSKVGPQISGTYKSELLPKFEKS